MASTARVKFCATEPLIGTLTVADELCDRVSFIVDGKIALTDSPRELKLQEGKKIVRVEYRESETEKKSGSGTASDSRMSMDFPIADIGNNSDFLNLLKKKDIETIHTQEATLEDIFINRTGKELRG